MGILADVIELEAELHQLAVPGGCDRRTARLGIDGDPSEGRPGRRGRAGHASGREAAFARAALSGPAHVMRGTGGRRDNSFPAILLRGQGGESGPEGAYRPA
jgi:hypothetical protein